MSHLDDEQLALLGLSERMPSADESAHLRDCADCAAELAQMTRTVLIARTTIDPETLEIPPDRVWAEVARELGFAGAADASLRHDQSRLWAADELDLRLVRR